MPHHGGERHRVGIDDLRGAKRLPRPYQLVAGGEKRDARAPAHRQPGLVEGGSQADVARGQTAPGRQGALATPKIQAGGTHEGARLDRPLEADPIAIGAGVLLKRHGIGTSRQQTAGEDAHRLAGAELPLVGAAGGRAADQAQARAAGREIRRAHRIAVHCRSIPGRLVPFGDQIAGEHAASGSRKVDPFLRQRRESRDDAGMSLFDGEHQSAV